MSDAEALSHVKSLIPQRDHPPKDRPPGPPSTLSAPDQLAYVLRVPGLPALSPNGFRVELRSDL